jgi:L-seryl-tRNA(Ser) seleniumtransferase
VSRTPRRRAGADHPAERTRALRALPSVDSLARAAAERLSCAAGADTAPAPHDAVIQAARDTLARTRGELLQGEPAPSPDELARQVAAHLLSQRVPNLRRVINAGGVIVNTNLGRAPLSARALRAVSAVAAGYSNLEFDLAAGERGSRQAHVRELLHALLGAENALAFNNNAAAVLVCMAALAAGQEVIVSRGELVEIGGGFRIPDILRQSGARLIEVGTTNCTRLADYAAAITPETALLLVVHPSNFRIVGFTEAPALDALAALAHAHGLPLLHDVGSGSLLPTERWGLAHEPMPQESLAAGADVVCFSGDKLLGGPQAGIVAGRAAQLERVARHPLARAVRIDKLSLAALEATLSAYRDGTAADEIPVLCALALPLDAIRERADAWAAQVRRWGARARTLDGWSTVGGGSLPGETLPTILCAVAAGNARAEDEAGGNAEAGVLAGRLRRGEPPVVARVSRGDLLLDPRTVAPEEDTALLDALRRALAADAPAP